MGPVGLVEPAAGSIETANAATSDGAAMRATRAAVAGAVPTATSPAGSGGRSPRMAQSSYVLPGPGDGKPASTTCASPVSASTSTRPLPANPSFGASDAVSV